MRGALLAVLAILGCDSPTEPPAARFCGVESIRVPLVIAGVPYMQTLIIPQRCRVVLP